MTRSPQTPILLTSPQRTTTTSLLIEAAGQRGMDVQVLTDLHQLEGLAGRSVYWYGGPLAAHRIAGRIGLGLLEPPDDWLTRLPQEFTGRRIELTTLAQAWTARRPVFVKPPSDKSFPAGVYADGSRLPRATASIGPDTPVLLSQVVTFAVEYRLFLIDHRIAAASRYAVYGRLDSAPFNQDPHEHLVRRFAERLLTETADLLPSAVTVDIGLIQDPGTGHERWAAVEANMPWFSHSYTAPADDVLEVVMRAAGPSDQVTPADRLFIRPAARPPSGRAV